MNTSSLIPAHLTCTRRIQFCAGHRVMGHESKCAHLHGHNYVVHLTAELSGPSSLDEIGRVVDFSVLKEKMGGWIEKHWDHGFLLYVLDEAGIKAMNTFNACMTAIEDKPYASTPHGNSTFAQKLFLMPYNPTAENMAKYLLEVVGPQQLNGLGVKLVKVVAEETENCSATAT